jgi:hypothetical protein
MSDVYRKNIALLSISDQKMMRIKPWMLCKYFKKRHLFAYYKYFFNDLFIIKGMYLEGQRLLIKYPDNPNTAVLSSLSNKIK